MSTFGFEADDLPDTAPDTQDLPEMSPDSRTYTVQERALRDLFVAEYLVDFDGWKAAMRCGFTKQFAIDYSKKFLGEPYVQRRINEIRMLEQVDEEKLEKYNKRRIREQLMAEAHYHGPGASQAARVAALKTLADLHGMGSAAAARNAAANAGVIAGGVMVVPVIANMDDWEQTAMASQRALQDDITEDTQ